MFYADFYRVLIQKRLEIMVSDVFLMKRKSAVKKQILNAFCITRDVVCCD
ncbi:hypothetical protein NC653_022199 [Populus alba x Populus x berolinensis]|uniref:Uncharacterized protein n=1 Tax=Populus alba x Populus x berolinensis TaxID=444605 RepID=A0AAD6QFQ9_9ROSI|nr:hypothetical protein NC653_022199 [Populus alba x Populus x berolinensis]